MVEMLGEIHNIATEVLCIQVDAMKFAYDSPMRINFQCWRLASRGKVVLQASVNLPAAPAVRRGYPVAMP